MGALEKRGQVFSSIIILLQNLQNIKLLFNIRIMQNTHPRLERQTEIFRLADAQRGYFTSAQVKQLGIDYPIQHYHKTVGNWLEIGRGMYRLSNYPSDPLDAFAALMLWSHNRAGEVQAVVGFESALLLYNLGEVLPSKTHLIVPKGFRKRPPSDVQLHKQDLQTSEISLQQGVRVTTPQKTLLDLAADTISPEHLERAVAQALTQGMVRLSKLELAAKQLPNFAQMRLFKAIKGSA
jgi:predicted transcriptional regulator of viral defense system